MNPLTQEWVQKAEEDFHVAERECRARKYPSYNAVCFHAQQCAEKYLKARLQEAGIQFPKTHSLPALLQMVVAVEPLWVSLRPHLDQLNIYAINFRYPGSSALKVDAKQALVSCRLVRREVRVGLGLPV